MLDESGSAPEHASRMAPADRSKRSLLGRFATQFSDAPVSFDIILPDGTVQKEDKNAINWSRLSCDSVRNNEVRLQLRVLAYNTLAKLSLHPPVSLASSLGSMRTGQLERARDQPLLPLSPRSRIMSVPRRLARAARPSWR